MGPELMVMPFSAGAMDRRALIRLGGAAIALVAISGCGGVASSASPRQMIVYRDPSCGCCEAWAELAKQHGFAVQVINHPDMAGLKRSKGVPDQLASCHTALINGYVIEGHVPFDAVERLLASSPADLAGVAVPGMPRGSPGMEMPDGTRDAFEVIAFAKDGRTKLFG
jgi:hypothetical protein